MNCLRCNGFLMVERLYDRGGSVLDAIEALKCVNCGSYSERGRRYGQIASGAVGNGVSEIKGSGKYERIGYGKSWLRPDLTDMEA